MKYVIIFFVAVIAMSSCTVEQNMHIYEKEKGRMMTSLDIEELSSMGEMFGADAGSMNLDELLSDKTMKDSIQMMLDYLNEMSEGSGISNWNMSRKDEKILVGYDFESFEALEKIEDQIEGSALGKNSEIIPLLEMAKSHNVIKNKRKCYEIFFQPREGLTEYPSMDEDGGEMDGLMKMMGDMVKVKQVFEFDREIKKVTGNVDYKQTDHSLTVQMSLNELLELSENKNDPPYIKVKVK